MLSVSLFDVISSEMSLRRISSFRSGLCKISVILIWSLNLMVASAFNLASTSSTILFEVRRSLGSGAFHNVGPSTALRVVADPPMKGEEKKQGGNNDKGDDDEEWTPTGRGGFIPNIRARLGIRHAPPKNEKTAPRKVKEVIDIHQYKMEVADVLDRLVCVRFYAPWCKSCKATESYFRRLPNEFPEVKFVEVPVTKENAYLHKGLGVPSLPFGHIYEPSAGLVEERKINKHVFAEFKNVLRTYVEKECPVQYDEDGYCVPMP